MKHLIDKDALVAEIKRIEYETNYEPFTDEVLGKRKVCKDIKDFLNTLEVKDVDLEKEFDKCFENYTFDNIIEEDIARRIFELGLKNQKGE